MINRLKSNNKVILAGASFRGPAASRCGQAAAAVAKYFLYTKRV